MHQEKMEEPPIAAEIHLEDQVHLAQDPAEHAPLDTP